VNTFILSCALALYAVSEVAIAESGLLGVTVAGFVLGYVDTPRIDSLKVYKSQLVDLLIGLLFILLAANLKLDFMNTGIMLQMTAAVLAVMLVVRPLNIMVSTLGARHFTVKEKLFLSWIAPRGIVAASMASVFAMNLKAAPGGEYADYAGYIETFTYSVIAATVIFQGFTAKLLGRMLGVLEPEPRGWLIVGAHSVATDLAAFIADRGFPVTLIDTNIGNVNRARRLGLNALFDSALTADAEEYPELHGIGNVFALTRNEDLNELVCMHWSKKLKNARLFRWSSQARQADQEDDGRAGLVVWSGINLQRLQAMTDGELKSVLIRKSFADGKVGRSGRVLFALAGDRLYPHAPDDV
jgi:hypothetical protein